jgi:acyl-CoA thioesterase FadM
MPEAEITSTEHVIGTMPFVVRRRVKFGECDPAGFVYTVVFGEYTVSAAELFYGSLFGSTPQRVRNEIGLDTPTRALEFDFRNSLRPDDEFDMTVTVADIRTRTYVLAINARTPLGIDVFQALLTPICVARDVRRAMKIPEAFRIALEQYRTACAASAVAPMGIIDTQSHSRSMS